MERISKKELEAILKEQKEEIDTLKQSIETRGREEQGGRILTEGISFLVTKSQKERLKIILKENKVSLSNFIRHLIFGDGK